jgi:hypothetical protein
MLPEIICGHHYAALSGQHNLCLTALPVHLRCSFYIPGGSIRMNIHYFLLNPTPTKDAYFFLFSSHYFKPHEV